MKRVVIVGTGLSAMSVLEALKNIKNIEITILESGKVNKKKILRINLILKNHLNILQKNLNQQKKNFLIIII